MAIRLEKEFVVETGGGQARRFLSDPERVVPCIPSVQVVERNEDGSFEAEAGLPVGPLGTSFRGRIEAGPDGRVRLTAGAETVGKDARLEGVVEGRLEEAGEGRTRVILRQEVELTGTLSALGESALARNVADMVFGRFARCVARGMEA